MLQPTLTINPMCETIYLKWWLKNVLSFDRYDFKQGGM